MILRKKTNTELIEEIKRLRAQIRKLKQTESGRQNHLKKEYQYGMLFNHSPSGILIQDENGTIIDVNPAFCKFLKYKKSELIGKNVKILASPENVKFVKTNISQILSGKHLKQVVKSIRKDGSFCYMDLNEKCITLPNGKKGVLCLAEDITEKRIAEMALRESEDKFRTLIENIDDIVYSINKEGYITYISPSVKNLLGYSDEELVNRHFSIFVYKEDLELAVNNFSKILAGRKLSNDYRILNKYGKVRLIRTSSRPVYESKIIKGIYGVMNDITESQRAEFALRDSEEKFKNLFKNSPDSIFLTKIGGKNPGEILDVNPAAVMQTGYSRKELTGMNIVKDLSITADVFDLEKEEKKLLSGKTVYLTENKRRKDGSEYWAQIHISAINLKNQNIALSVQRDITSYLKAQKALEESEEKYHALFDNAADIIALIDVDGKILELNNAFTKETGYIKNNLIGKKLFSSGIVSKKSSVDILKKLKSLIRGTQIPIFEIEIIHKKGHSVPFEIRAVALKKNGKTNAVQATLRNISNRREHENELKESEINYRELFDKTNDAIYLQDEQGRFINVNHGAEKMYGYPREYFVGKTPEFLSAPGKNDLSKIAALITKAFKGKPQIFEFWGLHKNGSVFPKEVRLNKATYFGQNVIIAMAQDITKRKQAEVALRESEERYRKLTEFSPNAIAVHSDGKLVYVNEAAVKLMEAKNKKELLGKPALHFVHPDYRQIAAERIKKMMSEGKAVPLIEEKFLKLDGTPVDVEVKSIPIIFNEKPAIQVVIRDISKQKNALQEIIKKSKQQENLLGTARHLTASLELKQVFNKIAIGVTEILETYSCSIYLLEKDGKTLKPVVAIDPEYEKEVMSTSLHIDDSFTGKSVIAGRGIIFNDTRPGLGGHQIPGTPVETEERLITTPFIVDNKAIGAMCLSRIGKEFTEDELAVAETFATYASAALKNARIYKNLHQEVEDRKIAQKKLHELNLQYKSFIQNSLIGIWKLEFEKPISIKSEKLIIAKKILELGYFTDCNNAFAKMYGFSKKEELIGKKNNEFIVEPETSLHRMTKFVENNFKMESINSIEKDIKGRVHHFRNSYFGIVDQNKLKWIWGVQADITEQKKLEEQLRQSQKMEAVGTLAGGIAHDFNNLLTVINGAAEFTIMKLENNHYLNKYLVSILNAGKRAENLTRQLLAFSRKQIIEPKIIDLNLLISDMDKMLHRFIGEDIDMQTILPPGMPLIKADPGQIEQILLNLIVNARDAINLNVQNTTYKKITIETGYVYIDQARFKESFIKTKGWHVFFTVTDNGIGMNEEIKSKIFEPFFTTKEVGKGTGLGMSTVYGIVKQNKGYISVYSELGEGTTFKVYWPVSEENKTELQKEEEKKYTTGNETILIVEDDNSVRNFTRDTLEELGYNVLEAINGKKALELIEGNNLKIDLLISDLIMPEMNGKELAAEIKSLIPENKILFTSGYTDSHIVHSGTLEKGINFLQKPFSIQMLSEKVRTLLDSDS